MFRNTWKGGLCHASQPHVAAPGLLTHSAASCPPRLPPPPRTQIQVWDVTKEKVLRSMEGHRARVGTLAWGNALLSSGSRDRCILHSDVRAKESYVAKLVGHRSEVCGLKVGQSSQKAL